MERKEITTISQDLHRERLDGLRTLELIPFLSVINSALSALCTYWSVLVVAELHVWFRKRSFYKNLQFKI